MMASLRARLVTALPVAADLEDAREVVSIGGGNVNANGAGIGLP
jgi:hypothetical protein